MNNPLYLIAGFGLTWGVLVWYTWRLTRRIQSTAPLLDDRGDSDPGSRP